VCWQILSLEYLYPGIPRVRICDGVMNGTLRPKIPAQWPKGLRGIIQRGWNQNPKLRPSAKELKDALVQYCKTFFED